MQRFLFIILFLNAGLHAADNRPVSIYERVRTQVIPATESVRSLRMLAAHAVLANSDLLRRSTGEDAHAEVPAECVTLLRNIVRDRQALQRARDVFGYTALSDGNFAKRVAFPIVIALQRGLRLADIGWPVNKLQERYTSSYRLVCNESLICRAAGCCFDNMVRALHAQGASLAVDTLKSAVGGKHPTTIRLYFELGGVYDFDDTIYGENAQVSPDQESFLDTVCDEWQQIGLDEDEATIRALAENGVPCHPRHHDDVCVLVPEYPAQLEAFNAAYARRAADELAVIVASDSSDDDA